MSYERWREDHRHQAGSPHPDHQPLFTPPQPPARQTTGPSDRFKTCAGLYLTWFRKEQVEPQARYNMMTTPTDTNKIERELEVIRITRLLCPDLKVDMEKSDIGWNEQSNIVFLILSLKGKHTGYPS